MKISSGVIRKPPPTPNMPGDEAHGRAEAQDQEDADRHIGDGEVDLHGRGPSFAPGRSKAPGCGLFERARGHSGAMRHHTALRPVDGASCESAFPGGCVGRRELCVGRSLRQLRVFALPPAPA